MCAQQFKLLIVSGGHNFNRESFFEIFDSFPNIEWEEAIQPKANQLILNSEVDDYDVLVFYDMYQDISNDEKKAFIKMLKKGKPLLFLHHSLASYQNWDEYLNIVGGKYYEKNLYNGKLREHFSNFKHSTNVNVQILQNSHPIVDGLSDFTVFDEVYGDTELLKNVTPFLKTNHPNSSEIIGWENKYKSSKIIYLQPGHGEATYKNESYRRLIYQSINYLID